MKLCTLIKYKRIFLKLKKGKYPKEVAYSEGVTLDVVYNAVKYFRKNQKDRK